MLKNSKAYNFTSPRFDYVLILINKCSIALEDDNSHICLLSLSNINKSKMNKLI